MRARILLAIFTSTLVSGCGGNVEITSGAGGVPSASAGPSTGGTDPGTGEAPQIDTECNGLFSGGCIQPSLDVSFVVPNAENDATVDYNCDLPLNSSPTAFNCFVWIDCVIQPQLPYSLDAGSSNGIALDYAQNPAHLKLIGSSCNALQTPGLHHVILMEVHSCIK
jgi:hypothetical protein